MLSDQSWGAGHHQHNAQKMPRFPNPRRGKEELSYAHTIFSQNPIWPVIDVTGKSLEELAHEVLDNLFGKERGL